MLSTNNPLFAKSAIILILVMLAVPLASCGRKQDVRAEEEVDLADASIDIGGQATATETVDPQTVLVRVNGHEITRGDVDEQLQGVMAQAAELPPEQKAQIEQRLLPQILDNIIVQHLLRSAVIREQISLDGEEVDNIIAQIEESMPADTSLDEQLAVQGMDRGQLRSELALNLRIEKLIEKHSQADEAISDEDIASFYADNPESFQLPERVTASHILIEAGEDADDDTHRAARAEAERLRQQLEAGADFAALAEEFSDCPSSRQGGNLGTFGRGQMDQAFEQAAFSQDVNEIGEVVQSRFGYHVIKVSEHEQPETVALEDVSEQIREHLEGQDQQERIQEYVQQLKNKADIEYVGMSQPRAPAPAPIQ